MKNIKEHAWSLRKKSQLNVSSSKVSEPIKGEEWVQTRCLDPSTLGLGCMPPLMLDIRPPPSVLRNTPS